MLFNVENDFGDRIIGYAVPDGYTSSCRIRVNVGGEAVSLFETNEERAALVHGGRHETGLCGFTIDERDIPNLAMLSNIEIFDDESGCLIYRRAQPHMIDRKIVRFETQLLPLWRLDSELFPHFQYVNKGVDRYGRETVTQILLLENVSSMLISGRINFKGYAYYLDGGFECFTMVQSPHDELAERLLVLRNGSQLGARFLGERDAHRLEPAIRFAESLPLDDPNQLERALIDIPDEVAKLLANPLTRQFSTANPDEMPAGGAVAATLDVLSRFTVVGLRDHMDDFIDAVAEWLGIEGDHLPRLPPFAQVSPLGGFLRNSGILDSILEFDMAVYTEVLEARKAVTA